MVSGTHDATIATLFVHACHLCAGDLEAAEHLLRATLTAAGGAGEDSALIKTCHREYLTRPTGASSSVIGSLNPIERVLLSLRYVVGADVDTIARVLDQPGGDVEALLGEAEQSFVAATHAPVTDAPVVEEFRHTQRWLDDGIRERTQAHIQALLAVPEPGGSDRSFLSPRARVGVFGVACIVAATVGFAITYQRGSTSSGEAAGTTTVAAAATAATTAGASATGILLDGYALTLTAAALDERHDVVPDAIVRYANNRIGISWHGPCNEPGASVEFSSFGSVTGVRLIVGSFPVKTCIGGMPDRWATVVQSPPGLADGPLAPMDANGQLIDGFTGYSFEPGVGDVVDDDAGGQRSFSSALIDQDNEPWVFVEGDCNSATTVRYPSPVGALYEVTTTRSDPPSCPNFRTHPYRLAGTDDRWFPHEAVQGDAAPIDCRGPRGSQTDLRAEPAAARELTDGTWSTWDGCIVRVNVIRSQQVVAGPGCEAVRTLTFATNIGEQFNRSFDTRTFVRTPDVLAQLPGGSFDTGLRFGTDELWLPFDDSTPIDAVYMVTGLLKYELWRAGEALTTC